MVERLIIVPNQVDGSDLSLPTMQGGELPGMGRVLCVSKFLFWGTEVI